ncbi:MAG: baseplate J/gp47 family protein [Anaerolineales bacterium]
MKTQIIHLESHDDTISVIDKMDWSQTPRVLLIWPEKTDVLTGHLDLVILERHCTSLGSQLALVTSQPDVRYNAEKAGIPVFKSREEAQTKPWPRSQRFYRRRSIQEKILEPREVNVSDRPQAQALFELPRWGQLAVFTVSVIAVLAVAFLLLPQSEIHIPIQDQWAEIILPVRASPEIKQVYVSGAVPAREISVSIEKRSQGVATGTLAVPDTYASGEVRFTNLTDNEIELPQNTTLFTGGSDPIRYQTASAVTIPAGIGEEVKADIQAKEPGTAGNQDAGAISGIGADVGADLTVTNPEPIQGGKDMYIPIPTEQDRQRLTNRALKELKETALDSLRDKMEPGDILLSETPNVKEIEDETFTPAEGEPGETLELTIRVTLSAWIVTHDDLNKLAEEVMRTRQQSSQYQPIPDSLTFESITKPIVTDDQNAEWELMVKWQRKPKYKKNEIVRLVLGQTPAHAKAQLTEEYNLSNPPQISTRPAWWPRLPFLPFRINVN